MDFKGIPAEVEAVFRRFRTCELTTFSPSGAPTTWPVSALYQPEQSRFLFTTSIGFAQKAYNIRRDPKVAMLYSDPTGSGLHSPPAVLVQGEGVVSDQFITAVEGLEDYWRETIFRRQPTTGLFSSNFITRWLMDWNFMRLIIQITPHKILWWPGGDFSRPPQRVQAAHVETAY
jgi:hypothetical protein